MTIIYYTFNAYIFVYGQKIVGRTLARVAWESTAFTCFNEYCTFPLDCIHLYRLTVLCTSLTSVMYNYNNFSRASIKLITI